MRIVGGSLKGKNLSTPKDNAVRPTSDRVRESLFNILAHGIEGLELEGAYIADLFAGTGALGIEALSRGAQWCLFVDDAAASRGLIRENTMALGLNGKSKISRQDATDIGPRSKRSPQFDLVFADPPYDKGLGEKALASLHLHNWLKPNAILVLEETKRATIKMPDCFEIIDERKYGDTQIIISRYKG